MKITQCEKKIISGLFCNLWDTKNHADYSWNMESSRNILCLLSKESYSMGMKWNRGKHKHDSKSWCPFYVYPFQNISRAFSKTNMYQSYKENQNMFYNNIIFRYNAKSKMRNKVILIWSKYNINGLATHRENDLFFPGELFIRTQSSIMSGNIIYGLLSSQYTKIVICNLIKNELLDLITVFSTSER